MDPEGATLSDRFLPPAGFVRTAYPPGSFGHYLQYFPLRPDGAEVMFFNGQKKYRQDVHAAVLDIDVGDRDLQQCADAVMRLRAEYLWRAERYEAIRFNFTNGFPAPYSRWRAGERIQVAGSEVQWIKRAGPSESYRDFRRYLTMVFAYAGTLSLARDLHPKTIADIEAGNVFIQGGSPGHAIIVVDKAVHPETGEILVMLAQSYMPAQDIHILHNFTDNPISPWYAVSTFSEGVQTPEWRFNADDLAGF